MARLFTAGTLTHFRLPTIHRLLILLSRFEDQHIYYVQVGDLPVSLKVGPLLDSDHRGGDIQCVKRDNLGSLR